MTMPMRLIGLYSGSTKRFSVFILKLYLLRFVCLGRMCLILTDERLLVTSK